MHDRNTFALASFVHINEIKGGAEAAAHLLVFDSVQGRWPHEVTPAGNSIVIDGKAIGFTASAAPGDAPRLRRPRGGPAMPRSRLRSDWICGCRTLVESKPPAGRARFPPRARTDRRAVRPSIDRSSPLKRGRRRPVRDRRRPALPFPRFFGYLTVTLLNFVYVGSLA